jgi:hypothetical protein
MTVFEVKPLQQLRRSGMPNSPIDNITCGEFATMSEDEQRAFIIGVANGRGMTSGLFQAYAGAAQCCATTTDEREAIERSYEAILLKMSPLLEIDPASLLNGVRSACRRAELQDEPVINALASVHLDAAKALKEYREQTSD